MKASLLFIALQLIAAVSYAEANPASDIYQAHRDSLYTIKVVDRPSGDRSALGSGFAVDDFLIATNYHVIAEKLERADQIDIYLVDYQNNEQAVELIAVDAINDLALLRPASALTQPLRLAENVPEMGATVYALGNPYDLGMSVTEGIFNGVKEGSFPPRIHYAGPVNSGMSGGPSVNIAGEVVGINVASARNSVGFLVPVAALKRLINEQGEQPAFNLQRLQQATADQVELAQSDIMQQLLAQPWPREGFGGAMVPTKGAALLDCWGRSDEEEDRGFDTIHRGCNNGTQINISSELNTLYVEYEFAHISSDELLSYQLYNRASRFLRRTYPGNYATEEHVSNYQCVEDNVSLEAREELAETRFKVLYCSRAYRHIPSLYDAFFVAMTTDREQEIIFSHFTLSGFTRTNIEAFLQRFMASVQWQS